MRSQCIFDIQEEMNKKSILYFFNKKKTLTELGITQKDLVNVTSTELPGRFVDLGDGKQIWWEHAVKEDPNNRVLEKIAELQTNKVLRAGKLEKFLKNWF